MSGVIEFCDVHQGFVTASVTLLLVFVTAAYVWLLFRQQCLQKKREEKNDAQAIRTMAIELQMNMETGYEKQDKSKNLLPCPRLDAAYSSCLWAVSHIGMQIETTESLGRAYLSIRRYNSLYHAAQMGDTRRAIQDFAPRALKFWEPMQETISRAIKALQDDPATRSLIREVSSP